MRGSTLRTLLLQTRALNFAGNNLCALTGFAYPPTNLNLKLYLITSNRFGTMRTLGVGRGNAGLLRKQKMSRNLTMTIVSADLVKVIVEQLNAEPYMRTKWNN